MGGGTAGKGREVRRGRGGGEVGRVGSGAAGKGVRCTVGCSPLGHREAVEQWSQVWRWSCMFDVRYWVMW